MKKLRDHAAAGLENVTDLELWLWAVELKRWAAIDRLLRRSDLPMPHEARIVLADALKSKLPQRRRGRPSKKEQRKTVTRMMKFYRQTMSVSQSAEATAKKIPKDWKLSKEQIENRWSKGKL